MPGRDLRESLTAALTLAAAATFALAPLLLGDLVVDNEDFRVHFGWVRQWTEAWEADDFYPQWMPLANGGLGEPAFQYYPPLFHAASTALGFVLGDFWRGMKAALWLSCWATGWLGFGWVREHRSWTTAMLTGLALQLAPFSVFVEVRLNAWPWYCAMPWLLLLLRGTLDSEERRSWPAAIALAGLTLTHVLTAFLALLSMPLAVGRLRLARWSVAVAGGLAFASPYLYPALMTMDWISPEGWTEADFRDWRNRFVFPVAGRVLGRPEATAYQWLIPVTVLFATAALAWFWRRSAERERELMGRLLLVSGVAWFFATEVSYPLWVVIPGLELVQFPFRFLYVAGTASLLGIAFVRHPLRDVVLALSLVSGVALGGFGSFVTGERAPLELARAESYPGRSEYLPSTVGLGWREYTERQLWKSECPRCTREVSSSGLRVEVVGVQGELRLPVFEFPRWTTSMDGNEVSKRIDSATGLIVVDVPSEGRHEIEIRWE